MKVTSRTNVPKLWIIDRLPQPLRSDLRTTTLTKKLWLKLIDIDRIERY